MSQIGIKLANHDFFPIIDENEKLPIEKEMELTTVRDNQESVQINLFKSDGKFEPVYIGSLIIEDLKEMSCEDSTIILKLKLDENKNLNAEAIDKNSGNKQSLTISVSDLGQFSDNDFDGFDSYGDVASLDVSNFDTDSYFNENDETTERVLESNDTLGATDEGELSDFSSLSDVDFSSSDVDFPSSDADFSSSDVDFSSSDADFSSSDVDFPSSDADFSSSDVDFSSSDTDFSSSDIDEDDELYEEKRASFPTWLKIFLIILVLGILALIVALFLKNKMRIPKDEAETIEVVQQNVPPIVDETPIEELSIDELTTEAPQKQTEPFPTREASSSEEASDLKESTPSDNKESKKEEVKVVKNDSIKKAVRYRIRWGDTLWDISGNFYKNPWAYKRIARYNKIKNPHRIVAGTYITIPAK